MRLKRLRSYNYLNYLYNGRVLKGVLTTLLSLFVFYSTLGAQGYVDILPDEVKNPFFERHGLIKKDLEKLSDNEWAGNYTRYIGETWSEVFSWSPHNGFAVWRDTCSNGPRAWVNYGTAKFDGGLFIIGPERDEKSEYVINYPQNEFTPVKWGEQHWLIPTSDLALFAYGINSGSSPDYESFYLKSDDLERPRKGQPNLPPEYKRLLGLPPIKGKVISVGPKPEKWYPAMTIDAGRDKKVIVGMSFWLKGMKNTTFRVGVKEVQDRTAIVEMVEVGFGPGTDSEIEPKLGWRFTSRCCR